MIWSAAAMYAGAAFVSAIESWLVPGGPSFSTVPGFLALAMLAPLLLAGFRVPRPALWLLGPIGATMIAYALASTGGVGDGAVLYMWPVLWVAYFYGRPATAAMAAWVGVAHGVALSSMPAGVGYADRWFDVMVAVVVVGAVVHALSERNQALVARLIDEARVDQLTGVLNRRGFDRRLADELARAAREGYEVAAVAVDLDHFKRVNDDWGHTIGDQALIRVGAVLRSQARAVDVVARLGGDEFIAILPRCDALRGHAYAERMRFALAAIETADAPAITISAGVVAAAPPIDARALLVAVDRALYAAKRDGRDRTSVVLDGPERLLGAA
jgi:diguanylate cyclase (GGDEF)-like protein